MDDDYSTPRFTQLTVNPQGVLANDCDPDQDNMTVDVAATYYPSFGTLDAINADGSFTYTPPTDPNSLGDAVFWYRNKDTSGATSNYAAVDIRVFGADIDTDSDNDGYASPSQAEEDLEMNDPGRIVPLNDDDDDNNGQEDRTQTGPISQEDNLAETWLEISHDVLNSPFAGTTVTLDATAGSSFVKVWTTANKAIGTEITLPATWTVGSQTMPSPVYVEGIQPGVSTLKLSYGPQPAAADEAKYSVLKVDLDIGNGQNTGVHVSQGDEYDVGAFTVANKNDTDGDGRIDSIENNVRAFSAGITNGWWKGSTTITVQDIGGWSVGDEIVIQFGSSYERNTITAVNAATWQISLASGLDNDYPFGTVFHPGRYEVDLMPLTIHQPDVLNPNDLTMNLYVNIPAGGPAIKLWDSPWKGQEIPTAAANHYQFFALNMFAGIGTTFWVETLDPSVSVRDIQFTLEYQGATDKVRATSIWATLNQTNGILHDRVRNSVLMDEAGVKAHFPDLNEGTKTAVEVFDGVGLIPNYPNAQISNAILIQLTIVPAGVRNEPLVKFDATRQKQEVNWFKDNANDPWEVFLAVAFPPRLEEPNDDVTEDGESDAPTASGNFYAMDAPGVHWETLGMATFHRKMTFREWLRVSFDGQRPTGNITGGSRVGDTIEWHARQDLVDDGNGHWVRTTPDNQETTKNDIGLGAIDVTPEP